MTLIAVDIGQIIPMFIFRINTLSKMPIKPIKGMDEFKRLKKSLKNIFESERSGEQVYQREQTKAFEPLINIQKETSKATQDKIASSQASTTNALMPLVQEMQRRNDQIDMLASQPFYQQQRLPDIPQEETLEDIRRIDLDRNLNDSDIQNLNDMSFELHNKLFANKPNEEVKDVLEATLADIKTKERSLRVLKASKKSEREGLTEMYKSQHTTLRKYEGRLLYIGESVKLITSTPKKKSGQGLKNKKKSVDVIICSSHGDLYRQLKKFCAAKEAENTGVDNHINSCLDTLLKEKAIDSDDYKNLYKKIFYKKIFY